MLLHLGLLQNLEYKRFRGEVNVNLIHFLPSGYRGAGREGRGRATYIFIQGYFTLVIVYFWTYLSLRKPEDCYDFQIYGFI